MRQGDKRTLEVKQVYAIVSNPVRDGDMGRVTTGYYTVAVVC
jgi:hypothetical protein